MTKITEPVIVTYQRLSGELRKVFERRPEEIIRTVKKPGRPKGYESFEADEAPAGEEDAVRLQEELARALKHIEAAERAPGVLAAPDDQFTSVLQSELAKNSVIAGKLNPLSTGGYEAQFDEHDILGWAKSLLTWVKGLKPHKFTTPPVSADKFPNTTRVGILGDWGTGLYGAPPCAASLQRDGNYGILVHLGDVYYSGTESEVADRFLGLWPAIPGAVNRACNSNHEMYTGGYAYFERTLPKFGQSSSCWALQNDHWLLVGLDSAYREWELANDQAAWLSTLLASSGDRRVILFSHHQLFSWAEKTNVTMRSQLGELLANKKLFAWYWGHEHRCMVYDKHPVWNLYGRLVGHSGYPYFRDNFTAGSVVEHGPQDSGWRKVESKDMVPGGILLEGPNPYVSGHENEYGPNGYMTIEFNGSHLNEIVHAPDGSIAYSRELV